MNVFRWVVVMILMGVTGAGVAGAAVFVEGFESGYTDGTNIAAYAPAWYGDGGTNSPTIQAGQGVAGSVGLSEAKNCFNWSAHPFAWTDPSVTGVIMGMDFQAAAEGDANFPFSDDRIGWTTSPGTSDTGYIFCVQLAKNGTGGFDIQGYYKSSPTGSTRTDTIVSYTTPVVANAWYRFQVEYTKLSDTSARIDAAVRELDASGVPGSVIVTGTVANTAATSGGWTHTPPAALFTAATICPSYKNYDQKAPANADNAYFEIVPEPTTLGLMLGGLILALRPRRRR
jgi:hypothetical protein